MPRPDRITRRLTGAEHQELYRAITKFKSTNDSLVHPADLWDWLTTDDLLRVALTSFRAAREAALNYAEDRFQEEGLSAFNDPIRGPWMTREIFCENVAHQFAMRLAKLACTRGLESTLFESLLQQLAANEGVANGPS